MPDVPPGISAPDNPTLRKAGDFGGNHVLIRMRKGLYALYAPPVDGVGARQAG